MNNIIPFMRKPRRLAVEIGDWVKIAESTLTPSGYKISGIRIKKTLEIKGELSAGIKAMLKEADITINQTALVVPRQFVTIRNLELPSVDKKEIREIVDLQASKQTPYSREEIIFGFKARKSAKNGYSDVLLAIAKKDIIEERMKVLKEAGLDVGSVRLGSEGIYRYFMLLDTGKSDKTTLLIDIDNDFSDILIISNNNFEYTRNITIGKAFTLKNPDNWKSSFIAEIKKSLEIYCHETGSKNIERILLTGMTEGLDELLSVLRLEFHLPVNTAGGLNPSLLSNKTRPYYKQAACDASLSSITGILCSAEELSVNLLPQDAEIERRMKEKTKNIINAGILTILFFTLFSAIFMERFYTQNSYYNTLHDKFLQTEKEALVVETMKVRVDTIRQHLDKKGSALNILQQLFIVMPRDVYLTDIGYVKNKEVDLSGRSLTMSDVFKLVTLLEELDCFEKVKTNYATKTKKEDREVVDFELTCPVKE